MKTILFVVFLVLLPILATAKPIPISQSEWIRIAHFSSADKKHGETAWILVRSIQQNSSVSNVGMAYVLFISDNGPPFGAFYTVSCGMFMYEVDFGNGKIEGPYFIKLGTPPYFVYYMVCHNS